MPLPRFARLAATEQRRLLAVATRHIAERGVGEISLNSLADEAGISRSALYNYFDGREDLIAATTEAALDAVAEALGAWERHADEASLWASFHASTARLTSLLTERPDLRVILRGAEGSANVWVDAFFADAVRLGLVTALNQRLAQAATSAVIAAADVLELAQPGSVTPSDLQALLRRVWN